jgi:hypothetical protein
MIKIIGLISLSTFLSCSQGNLKSNTGEVAAIQKEKCNNQVSTGDIEVCLPLVSGMVECYSNPIVKAIADSHELETNTIIGFYLKDSTYQAIQGKIDVNGFNDYCKLYTSRHLLEKEIGSAELDKLFYSIKSNYLQENWQTLKQKIESQNNSVSFDQPVLIETYSSHDKIRTAVFFNANTKGRTRENFGWSTRYYAS